jgi:hypothetical protein
MKRHHISIVLVVLCTIFIFLGDGGSKGPMTAAYFIQDGESKGPMTAMCFIQDGESKGPMKNV